MGKSDPQQIRAPWIDDPERGVNGRTLNRSEDVLGEEGAFGGRYYRFERILELNRAMVVYALYSPVDHTRTAYGFFRRVFEPDYVAPPREPRSPEP